MTVDGDIKERLIEMANPGCSPRTTPLEPSDRPGRFVHVRVVRARPCPAEAECTEAEFITPDGNLWSWCFRGSLTKASTALRGTLAILRLGHKPVIVELVDGHPVREVSIGEALQHWDVARGALVDRNLQLDHTI